MREILSPFGRSHEAITLPTGSGSAAISSSPRAMASTRASVSVSRSMKEAGRPAASAALRSEAFVSRMCGNPSRKAAAAARRAAILLLRRCQGQHARGGLRLLANREQVFAELRAGFGVHWSNR